MARLIRAHDNRNQPIVDASSDTLSLAYFNILRLSKGEAWEGGAPGFELLVVPLGGTCSVRAGTEQFDAVGGRADVWSGLADSVHAGTASPLRVECLSDRAEIAIAGGRTSKAIAPFRIPPEEVDMVDVGSPETHSRRRIFHILGNKHAGRAGNLLVSELYADPGCWSGYPPHKHDTDRPPEETFHEEAYHYRFRPGTGFGGQYVWNPGVEPVVHMTRDGDTFLLDRGYHPTVTSPFHEEYIFTILVGKASRSLVQYFDPQWGYVMDQLPGLADMRAKFK